MPNSKNIRLIQLPIAEGVDAGIDPKVSESPLLVENGTHKRRGAISKRLGQDRSSSAMTYLPSRLARHSSAVLAFGEEGVSYYIPSTDSEQVVGIYSPILYTAVRTASTYDHQPRGLDAARSGDIVAVLRRTYENGVSRTLVLETYDALSYNQIEETNLTSSSSTEDLSIMGRLLVVGGSIRCYYTINASTDMQERIIAADGSIGSVTTTTSIQVLAGNTTGNVWDCCVVDNSGSPYVAFAYCDSSTTDIIVAFAQGGDFTTINKATVLGTTAAATRTRLGIYALTSNSATVIWVEPNGANMDVKAEAYNISAASTIASGTVHTYASADFGGVVVGSDSMPFALSGIGRTGGGFSSADGGTIYVSGIDRAFNYLSGDPPESPHALKEITCQDSSGYSAASNYTYYRAQMIGKPTPIGDNYWTLPIYSQAWHTSAAATTDTTITQRNVIWIGPTIASNIQLDPVGKSFIGTAYPLEHFIAGGGGGFYALPTVIRQQDSILDPTPSLWALKTVEVTADASDVSWTYDGEVTRIGSSLGWVYDGNTFFDDGFLTYPEFPHAADGGGGSGPATGTYSYVLTYEWTDARGQRYQSAPSAVPFSYTHSTSNEVDVTVPCPIWGRNAGLTRIVVWRTVSGGTIYYRVGSIYPTGFPEVTFTDDQTDAEIEVNEQLYTTGGVLSNIQPPPYKASAIWQNRHVVADAEKGLLRYSREKVDGEPFIHNDTLAVPVDPEGGSIYALVPFSDKLVIFKARRILVTEGTGFNDIGGGTNFLNPYLISATVGSSNIKSIARIPQGIVFEGADGIWLLTSSFQLQPIGDRVRYYTDTHGPITGVAVVNTENYVVFSTAAGSALVYSWTRDSWMQWSNFTAADLIDIDGTYYRLDSQDYIWSKDNSNYDDNGSYIGLRLRTGWISKADVGGWYRLKRVLITGQNIAAHTLRIKVAYDGEANSSGPIWVDDDTITPSTLTDFTYQDFYDAGTSTTQTSNAYTLEYWPSHSKCSSFMIEISDEEDSGQTEGLDISSVAILVQPQPTQDTKHVGTGRQVTG